MTASTDSATIIADFDLGSLSSFFVLMAFAWAIVICLISAGVALALGKPQSLRLCLITAGAVFGIGVLSYVVTFFVGKALHWP